MNLYGFLKQVVEIWLKKDGFDVKVTPNSNTYLATTTFTLPPKTSGSDTLMAETTTQTLTNKTIAGASNTLSVRIANDVTGLGAGVATFLGTPTSTNLASAISDETGAGALVFATSPALTTPSVSGGETWNNISTPATPSAGNIKIYSKSDKPTYVDSTGTEFIVANTTTSLSNPMTTLGDSIYGAASGTATRLAGNTTTTRNFLRQTGTGAVSAAPAWDTILGEDVPLATTSLRGSVDPYTTNGVVYAGTYSPVPTTGSNTSAAAPIAANYTRVGNQVTVHFQITATNNTAGGTLSIVEVALPVASNLGSANDLNGTGIKNNSTPSHCVVYGSAANNRAVVQYFCQATANESIFGTFQYTVIPF